MRRETMRCDAMRTIRRATPRTSTRARGAWRRARDLVASGDEGARGWEGGAPTARARARGDDEGATKGVPAADAATTRARDARARERGDDEGAATTRACVAACARLDAEAAKGATRARRRVARATTTDSD